MERTLLNILDALRRTGGPLDPEELDRIIRARNREVRGPVRHVAKKRLLPFYQHAKESDPARWASWDISPQLEDRLVRTLRMKPMRTASGVATVTVLTKPWPCANACLYCPNDVRMPKSYLADEPACQRAERHWFDPYLQVAARLRTLEGMGHTTDKVELIVLGGSWTDYPAPYRTWFVRELFRALNDASIPARIEEEAARRAQRYESLGIPRSREECATAAEQTQRRVDEGAVTYNEAVRELYGESPAWQQAAQNQIAAAADAAREHVTNEGAAHRCVGLVVETRPDALTAEVLTELRALGATKVQFGVQSLSERRLAANGRPTGPAAVERAFGLARRFGFKIHAHFMANLLGATLQDDERDYARLVSDPAFLPDEVKLYPCALVAGTGLERRYREGAWRPYTEDELVSLLARDVAATPAYVRISRMIRDISSHDILVGNKKVNLRQLVDARLDADGAPAMEIRSREIGTRGACVKGLTLSEIPYDTAVSHERFLQWTTPEGRIAGFLRLSLPFPGAPKPLEDGVAMIREVHVYGAVARLGEDGGTDGTAQHAGLGRALIERACTIAREEGYRRIDVISAVGTRNYYRALGFRDGALYQGKELSEDGPHENGHACGGGPSPV